MITCYENARVFTADERTADCFVVRDGVFAFVGTARDAHRAYPDAERIDLHGQFVCPGFNDSHMHLLNLGCMLTQAQLGPATDSLAHMLSALSEYAQTHPQEAWILGHCWNQDDFTDEKRYPTRDDLDCVCSDRPCVISRVCGHVAVANSCALRLAGIDEQAHPVDGGRIVTDEFGRPNGVLE
ncbi:MAG: amidohydrolase family protein, partial [Candidatus Ventricola sp.]|nr:amidohydrolase family protein [Candidatus Ventricola sp.]